MASAVDSGCSAPNMLSVTWNCTPSLLLTASTIGLYTCWPQYSNYAVLSYCVRHFLPGRQPALIEDVLIGAHDPSCHGGMRLYPDASMSRCSHHASNSKYRTSACRAAMGPVCSLQHVASVWTWLNRVSITACRGLGCKYNVSCRAVRGCKKALEWMLRKLIPHQWLSLLGT